MTGTGDGPFVIRPGEARVIDVGGFDVLVHADRSTTQGAFSLIETRESEFGGGPPLHFHTDRAKSFLVLEGRYRMHIDGLDFDCPAGSFVHVPVGMRHTFQTAEAGSRKLNLYTPAGMVGYFDEFAAAISDGIDDAGLDALATRHGMEVVGPIPPGYL